MSRVPEKTPFISTRSKCTTETEPAGAVHVSGAAEDVVPPDGGLVITGAAGTSISKVVVDGDRRRATTVVAEVPWQAIGIRNESGTSFVKPTTQSNVTAEPGWAAGK